MSKTYKRRDLVDQYRDDSARKRVHRLDLVPTNHISSGSYPRQSLGNGCFLIRRKKLSD